MAGEAARVSRGYHGSHSKTGTILGLALAWPQSDSSIEQQVEAERIHSTWCCYRSRYRYYCHCCCYYSHCDDLKRGPIGSAVDGRRVSKGCIRYEYTCEVASCESCQVPKANQAFVEQEHARAPSRHSQSRSGDGPDLVKSSSPWL